MRWALCLLLVGCATTTPVPKAAQSLQPQESCKTLDRGLLKPIAKAEGSIDLADQVASERGKQVITLNGRLLTIAQALDKGCVR